MEARDLIDQLGAGDSPHAVAVRAGVPPKTLDTQLRSKSGLKPEMAVKIARAYGADPLVALVEVGLISADEAAGASMEDLRAQIARELEAERIGSMSDDQLTAEVRRLLAEVDRRLAARKPKLPLGNG